jgi:hypothetical protein
MTKVTYLSGAEHRRIPDQLQIVVGCSEDPPGLASDRRRLFRRPWTFRKNYTLRP